MSGRGVYVGASFPEPARALLAEGLAGEEVTWGGGGASNLVAEELDPRISGHEIVLGQPPLAAIVSRTADGPRWVALTSAGWARYAGAEARAALESAGVALTTSSAVYAEPCAVHALALALALARHLGEARDDQRGPRAWPAAELRARSRVLASSEALVLGYGAIGRRLVALLRPLVRAVRVVRTRVRGGEEVEALTREAALARGASFDLVLSTLPEGEATRGFVDRAFLAALAPGALFVNVGRGSTVDQGALLAALDAGRLAGAALDVTEPEPLPRDHPLWTAPNVLITPHTAGGRREEQLELVRHFLANLGRWRRGEPLADRVV